MSRAPHEELLHSPVGALVPYRDADGRPLCGEALIEDAAFRAGLELRRCPYAGSRRHHALPMNVSALRQMTRAWDEILATAHLLWRSFGTREADAGALPSVWPLMRTAHAAMCLPLYLLFRADAPLRDGEVPGFVSGLHKAAIDLTTASQLQLLLEHSGQRWHGSVHELVEAHGLFIGQKGVCAGPPHLIDELERALRGQHAPAAAVLARVETALGDLSGLPCYVDALLELAAARHLVAATWRRRLDALREAAARATGEPALAERLRAEIDAHPIPSRPSEIIVRQERLLHALSAPAFDELLAAFAHGLERLLAVETRAPGHALVQAARVQPVGDRARALVAATGAPGPLTLEIAAATDELAQLSRHLLAFAAGLEAALTRALGYAPGAPAAPLAQHALDGAIGVTPARYLGALLGLEVAITADDVSYPPLAAPAGTVARSTTP